MAQKPKPDNVVPFRKPAGPPREWKLPAWVPRDLVASVTGWIVLTNLVVWLAMIVASRGAGVFSRFEPETTFAFGSLVPDLIALQPWRLFSSTFVHADIGHIAMNMAILWFTGRQLERAYGGGRFAALYFVAAFTGSIFSLVWHLVASPGTSVGASGGVLGVVAGLAAFFWRATGRNSDHTRQWLWFCGLGLVGGLITSIFGMPVDNAAHLGGMLGGFLLSYFVFAGQPSWKPRLARAVAAIVVAAGMLSVGASLALSPDLAALEPETPLADRPERRAAVALAAGDATLAEKEASIAIDERPDDPTLRLLRATALLKLGREDEAQKDLVVADAGLAALRKRAPDDATVALAHGRVLFLLGRKDDAAAALAAGAAGRGDGNTYGQIAELLRDLGRLDDARKAAAKARLADRGNPRWRELHEQINEELAKPAPSPT